MSIMENKMQDQIEGGLHSQKLKEESMKTELKDVLHLYRGCDIECEKSMYKLKAVMIDGEDNDENQEIWVIAENDHHGEMSFNMEDCRPVLRLLSDMTNEESKELIRIRSGGYKKVELIEAGQFCFRFQFEYASSGRKREQEQDYDKLCPEQFLVLLKNSFDLFGLIESRQAIDKTKLKNKSMKTAKEYWKEKFDEYPQTDADKLAVAMMTEFHIASQDKWISEEAKTERNINVVSSFIEHCKEKGFEIPDTMFESYFNA